MMKSNLSYSKPYQFAKITDTLNKFIHYSSLISTAFDGYLWLCMVMYGYQWLFTLRMVMYGYVWLCMVMYGYVSILYNHT